MARRSRSMSVQALFLILEEEEKKEVIRNIYTLLGGRVEQQSSWEKVSGWRRIRSGSLEKQCFLQKRCEEIQTEYGQLYWGQKDSLFCKETDQTKTW